MGKKLIITVEFTDESDFDYYRHQFVGAVEDEVNNAMDKEDGGVADGTIEVGWDVED